jgi:hypothetical protein
VDRLGVSLEFRRKGLHLHQLGSYHLVVDIPLEALFCMGFSLVSLRTNRTFISNVQQDRSINRKVASYSFLAPSALTIAQVPELALANSVLRYI